MKRKIVAKCARAILLTLLLTSLLPLMNSVVPIKAQSENIYIRPDGSIDPPTTPIQRDGDIYTFTDNIYETIVVQKDNIIVDGAGYSLQGAGNDAGFDLSNRNNVTIKRTHITKWNYGVHLYNLSISNIIMNNNLTSNIARGISVSNSSANIIRDNNIVNNDGDGIFLWLTNDTSVTGNNVSNNEEDGISIAYSSFNNTITDNTVTDNSWAGIAIPFEVPAPAHNTITGNNITNNDWAGIHIDHVSGNTFYHNNIDNNTNQVVTVGATNIWDNGYPSGGNFWGDYTGSDFDGDGIGDTPYDIDGTNQDNYPFMNPWSTQTHDVAIVNVASSKTIVGRGYTLRVNVTVTNQGSYAQNFDVTAYANTSVIETETVTLESGSSTTRVFGWDTTDFAFGNYTLSAYSTHVPGETDTGDNTHINGEVLVTIIGDIDGDLDVDYDDFIVLAGAYGTSIGQPAYKPEADFDNDGDVDYDDFIALAGNYGKTL